MPSDTNKTAKSIYPLPLDQKIAEAADEGRRYSPSYDEWMSAGRYQRSRMTWPREVLDAIRRERP